MSRLQRTSTASVGDLNFERDGLSDRLHVLAQIEGFGGRRAESVIARLDHEQVQDLIAVLTEYEQEMR